MAGSFWPEKFVLADLGGCLELFVGVGTLSSMGDSHLNQLFTVLL